MLLLYFEEHWPQPSVSCAVARMWRRLIVMRSKYFRRIPVTCQMLSHWRWSVIGARWMQVMMGECAQGICKTQSCGSWPELSPLHKTKRPKGVAQETYRQKPASCSFLLRIREVLGFVCCPNRYIFTGFSWFIPLPLVKLVGHVNSFHGDEAVQKCLSAFFSSDVLYPPNLFVCSLFVVYVSIFYLLLLTLW